MNDHPARPDATPPAEATDAPDPATTPEAAPETAPETAPEAGPEAAPKTGAEVAPEPRPETASGPVPEVAPEAGVVPGPGPDGVAVAAPRRRVRWGRVLTGAACGALLLGVVGGVAYTVVAVDRADRDAGAPVWRFPKEGADVAVDGDKAGLAGLLVPYETDPNTDGFTRGPDIEEFGSDSEFSGRQATELRKESVRDLPRSQRLRLEKQIDRQHIQGMAMRSYVSPPDSLGYDGKVFTVDVVLSQMDKKAVRDVATFQSEFLNALEIFRKGPKIEGHKNAQCFLPPKDADEKLDLMVCSAYKGDVMVSATAYGAKPLDTKGVAVFLREQLDRIAEPGEAV
ncbi:hypothetical protein ACTMUQ_05935 [Streptomyces sp. SD11]|uniref:hypothetical protein n=1 Tax=Streptomyces sp. SD11 TaxID=3452209 RepID=UPI003F8BAFC7